MSGKVKELRVSDESIRDALDKTGGFLTLAAQRIGCSVRTIQRRVSAKADLQKALVEISDKKLDIAESSLMRAVQNGEAWAVCFYLKCKGKGRGYIERQEVAVADSGKDLEIAETDLDKIINESQVGENGKSEAVG